MGARWGFLAEAVLASGHGLCFGVKYEECHFFFLKIFSQAHLLQTIFWEKKYFSEKNRTWHFR